MHDTSSGTAALAQDRHDLGPLAPIQKAHARSQNFGLSTSMRPDYDLLSAAELAIRLEQNRMLVAQALPVMDTLHAQIAATQSMIVLADAHGRVLHSCGKDDFLAPAEKSALRPGANWAEDRQGTNAIGTALAERCAITVQGDQHYLAAYRSMTCSSVPIVDAYGAVAGVLDVTGDCRNYHPHTMALAKIAVTIIESDLFASTFRTALQIAFHSQPELLGTFAQGIVAFSLDGRCLSANRSAQALLRLPLTALSAHTAASLFGVTVDQLSEKARASRDGKARIALRNGAIVFANVNVDVPRSTVDTGERKALHLPTANAAACAGIEPHNAPATGPTRLADLYTGDPRMTSVIAKVSRVIGRRIPVLVTGETGTGKELLAQALHNESPRRHGPFVAVNCASIPETLIESELFGYEEGAFTGARRKGSVGKLLRANGGTLFLDEIGDMPYPLQVRLLRVLQERVVNPLGSTRSCPVDIDIVCATHRNLREMIEQNLFRQDRYYRLNGLVVKLPPLRERTDLAVVIERMLRRESLVGNNGQCLSVSADVMQLFAQCSWPGNLRQLANLLRTAAAMVDADGQIRRDHLPDDFFDDLAAQRTQSISARASGRSPASVATRLQDVEVSTIAAALAQHGGNVSAAARALGVSRTTIYRKMPSAPRMRRISETSDDR